MLAGFVQRMDLGVRLTRTLVRTLPDDDPLGRHDTGADERIRGRPSPPLPGMGDRAPHEPEIVDHSAGYHFS
jgi:hypothetical protein